MVEKAKTGKQLELKEKIIQDQFHAAKFTKMCKDYWTVANLPWCGCKRKCDPRIFRQMDSRKGAENIIQIHINTFIHI